MSLTMLSGRNSCSRFKVVGTCRIVNFLFPVNRIFHTRLIHFVLQSKVSPISFSTLSAIPNLLPAFLLRSICFRMKEYIKIFFALGACLYLCQLLFRMENMELSSSLMCMKSVEAVRIPGELLADVPKVPDTVYVLTL